MAAKQFMYTVLDRSGKEVTGKASAESEAAVRARLLTSGAAILTIKAAPSGLNREFNIEIPRRVKPKDLAIFARQFATMNNAGVSIPRALSVLAEQSEHPELRKTLHRVRFDVESGTNLPDSLAKHPRVFPPLMVNMTKAADAGGLLADTLNQIASALEADMRLRGRVKSAMTYPTLVLSLAGLMVVGMLTFVVPVFEKIFADMGGELPFLTQMLITASSSLTILGPVLVLGGIGAGYAWRKYRNDPAVRGFIDPLKLRIPVFGVLFRKVAIARLAQNLGSLLNAGVPILHALDIVADTSGSTVVAGALHEVQTKVRQGTLLADALVEHSVFPPMLVAMAAVGDEAGETGDMLLKIAEFYDEEVENTTKSLSNLLEPLLMVALGGVIGVIIFALYMPLFSVYDLIK